MFSLIQCSVKIVRNIEVLEIHQEIKVISVLLKLHLIELKVQKMGGGAVMMP